MPDRDCILCGKRFEYKRDDHYFCSGKCVAQYYRDNPNPRNIHCDLPHNKHHTCEHCGVPYSVNAYAERGGKRMPKYCSPKCKQAAYRARGQEAQEQAERRYGAGPDFRQHAQWEREHQEREQRQRQRRTAGSTGMNAQRAWQILGVSPSAPPGDIKRAYKACMKKCHPDLNKSPDATRQAQECNAAYGWMRKHHSTPW